MNKLLRKIDFIKINDQKIPKPPEFKPKREDIYAGEYTTCTGKRIADVIGWKYSDMTLEWDALPQDMVDILVNMTGECEMVFDDVDGNEITESVIRNSMVTFRHRRTIEHVVWWKDVSVEVSFINAHND